MTSWYGRGANAILLWLVLLLAIPACAAASPDNPDNPPAFQPEEIEALVAPIALYPDPLLSQVLMASTYPLEIVHAARWSKENPSMRGDAAVKAVENMSWDVSVKSLVAFPQILQPMNDKLDWTQKLGDVFLAQPADVFAAVQRLRGRAQESGNLQSNAQQKVSVEPATAGGQPQVVRIEPANPEVIYVPAYNPTVVYGGWSSPSYPPTYWPPSPAYYPGTALVSGFAWGVGLAAAGALFSDCNWGRGDVDINYNKVTNIDRSFNRGSVQGQGGRWQHDPGHRQGVAYRDNTTRQQYAGAAPGADRRAEYRGREPGGGASQAGANRANAGAAGADRLADGNRAGAAERGGAGNRAAAGDRATAGNRPTAADRSTAQDRAAAGDRSTAQNRAAAGDRSTAQNRAAAGDRSTVQNRTAPGDRAPSANRGAQTSRGAGGNASQAGTANRGGAGGATSRGRDSAFTGVGGSGGDAQRSYDRGRSSAQASSLNRSGGGGGGRGAAGGGGRGGGGGGGGRR